MQGTQVLSLVLEDPICCRATKPVCHNRELHLLVATRESPCIATLRLRAAKNKQID